MKCPTIIPFLFASVLVVAGCSKDSARQVEKSRQDAEAKARANAARKEMETLPKVFSTPDYFKKNEPVKSDTTTPAQNDPQKK